MAHVKAAARTTQEASSGVTTGTASDRASPAAPSADAVDRTLDRLEQEIFLSTRVVDQRSFEELASTLQRIIRESVSQGRSLLSAGDQVRGVSDNLRALIRDLQQRTEQAAKAAPLLEAKLTRAQTLVSRVTNESALAKAREMRDAVLHELAGQRDRLVEEAVEQAVRESRTRIQTEVQRAVAEALAQIPAHVSGLRASAPAPAAPQTIVHTTAPVTPILAQASVDEPRLREMMGDLERLIREHEAASEQAEARLDAVQVATESTLVRAEGAEKSLEEALLRSQLRFKHVVEEHERRTENVATEIAEQLLALRSDAQAQVAKATTLIDTSRERAAMALREMLESSRAQLIEQALGPVLTRAHETAEQETARSRTEIERVADGAVRRVESVTDATQRTIRESCEQALQGLGERLLQLREERAGLDRTLETTIARAEAQLAKAQELAERVSQPLEPEQDEVAAFFEASSAATEATVAPLEQLQNAVHAAQQVALETQEVIAELRTLRDDADSARESLGEQVGAAGEAIGFVDERLAQAKDAADRLESLRAEAERLAKSAPVQSAAPLAAPASVPIDQIGAILTQLIRAGVVQGQAAPSRVVPPPSPTVAPATKSPLPNSRPVTSSTSLPPAVRGEAPLTRAAGSTPTGSPPPPPPPPPPAPVPSRGASTFFSPRAGLPPTPPPQPRSPRIGPEKTGLDADSSEKKPRA
jgi:hypothetical protein